MNNKIGFGHKAVLAVWALIAMLAWMPAVSDFTAWAQEKKAEAEVKEVAGKAKSYPLPDALATQFNKLVIERDAAREAFLQYVSNPAIYVENETLRSSAFDRQEKLLSILQKANDAVNKWIIKQQEEFKCPTCVAIQKPNSDKWYFEEPTTNATTAK